MPVIEIRALPQAAGVNVGSVLAAVTQAVAALLGEEPRGTWATWDELEPGRYSEGGAAPTVQPFATHPPLVRIAGGSGKTPELVERILETVAATLAHELRIEPGNVFARYEQLEPGRLFSGGEVWPRA